MLKWLRAGLKGILRSDSGRSLAPEQSSGRAGPSAWFVEMRRRSATPDAALAGDIQAALARDPDNAEVHVLQGELAAAAGDGAAAVALLKRAVTLEPGFVDAHHALGKALHALGRTDEAIASFERAVSIAHDFVPGHVALGQVYEARGEFDDAADCFHLALAFDAGAVEAHLGLGRILRDAGRIADSVAQIRQAIASVPSHAPAFFELARSLNQTGDTTGAIGAYERAIALDPTYSAARVNLGLIHLTQLGDAPRAEACFRQAAQADPDLIEAQANLGLALQEQGRFDEARRHYEEQIRRWPDVIEFRWNRGIASLAAGDFGRGWDDFELRKQRPDAGGVHRKFVLPDWDGGPLAGRAILVYGEQGLGDEIMYGSCLPDVIERAELCVVECDARLAALYRRSFPRARIEARGEDRLRDWRAAYPALELQSAVASLPRYLRRQLTDFPDRSAYLVADAAASATWRARLGRSGSKKVGISWRGGTLKTRGSVRSLTLEQITPLLDKEGTTFVVLQRDANEEERALLSQRPHVLVPDIPPDLDEFAALLGALDVVISVDNTNVHLAGALGRPVWVLLSDSPEWRYLREGERSPWYPSARLVRQPRPGDWAAVIQTVRQRLDAHGA